MASEIDQNLLEVMKSLPNDWVIHRYRRFGMGWIAVIGKGKAELFQLVEDRFYIGVSKLVSGVASPIEPPHELRMEISPTQVAELILRNHP